MALGMIGTALVSVAAGMSTLTWWQLVLVFLGIMLVISGPSMLLAYFKLRRRNLAPVLNANGWAVNAEAIVNVPFGLTLTTMAKFPILKLKDPFAEKGLSWWQKLLVVLGFILVIAGGVCGYAYHKQIWFFAPKAECEQAVEAPVEAPVEVVEEVVEAPEAEQ